ncbi:tetratricopeptide repeat protein [Cognataquiflexum rubidum]|uniref:tetratricopeptide repeat protein n=1 Tax=Cognataquiflexum rubidum TaxID=2922273 RepID=UPI001F1345D7|nr:NB-ARC domain-containing protein [Cognataquiflexum rubidum]MCH6235922.1 NB-ARC domain-containing protein [Cognataquiflexum rubidum]
MGDFIKYQFIDSTLNNPVFKYGERKLPKHLGRLPFPPEVFLGRDKDLDHVHKLLFEGENVIVLINGEGGIGKTTFVSKYYYKFASEYSHMAWVFADKGLQDAILELALAMGVEFEESMTNEKRVEKVIKELAELDKPCLLILDNANNAIELERNYPTLRSILNFQIICTTRITKLSIYNFFKLKNLKMKEAKALFKFHYPQHESKEDSLLVQVLKAVGNNTLVIELLAKNINQFNNPLKKKYPLSELLKDLLQKGLFGIKTELINTPYQAENLILRREKPEVIISAMFDLGEITKDQSKILSIFSVLPPESMPYQLFNEILPDLEDLDNLLLGLAGNGWIEFSENHSAFKISPIIQEVVRKKNEDSLLEDCQPLIMFLNFKLEYEGSTGHFNNSSYTENITWGRYAEFATGMLLNLYQLALPEREDIVRLFDSVGFFHNTTGNLENALTYFKVCLQLSESLLNKYPINERFKHSLATSNERVGNISLAIGDLEKALKYFEEGNKLRIDLVNKYPQNLITKIGLSISFSKLGDTQLSLGDFKTAERFYFESNLLVTEAYSQDPRNEFILVNLAPTLERLGNVLSMSGRLHLALGFYKKYNIIYLELNKISPQNEEHIHGLSLSFQRLGDTYIYLGEMEKGGKCYFQYHHFSQDLYKKHPLNLSFQHGYAISLLKLADFFIQIRNTKESLKYSLEAFDILKELLNSNPRNIQYKKDLSISCLKIGDSYLLMNDFENALFYFEKYNGLEKELLETSPKDVEIKNKLAVSFLKLGVTHQSMDNLESATENYEQYYFLQKELYLSFPDSMDYKYNFALSNSYLADSYSTLGKFDDALTFYEKDLSLVRELYNSFPDNVEFKKGLAFSLKSIGFFHEISTKPNDKWKQYYYESNDIFSELNSDFPNERIYKEEMIILEEALKK